MAAAAAAATGTTKSSTTHTNVTSSGANHTLPTSTDISLGNSTLTPLSNSTTAAPHDDSTTSAKQAAVAVAIVIVFSALLIVVLFFFLKKIGKLPKFCEPTQRKRRSSTSSSRRALDDDSCETESVHRPNEKLKQTTEEMFTIDDFEEPSGERERDEYYYDEVFGQSEFEDESTKQSVSQLYSQGSDNSPNGNADEMLDFDFETLGIKIDDYSVQAARKVSI